MYQEEDLEVARVQALVYRGSSCGYSQDKHDSGTLKVLDLPTFKNGGGQRTPTISKNSLNYPIFYKFRTPMLSGCVF